MVAPLVAVGVGVHVCRGACVCATVAVATHEGGGGMDDRIDLGDGRCHEGVGQGTIDVDQRPTYADVIMTRPDNADVARKLG